MDTLTPTSTAATTDSYRPALHFTAKDTWLNDPNGLIFHDGVYHLYYQNNPLGNVWGNMSWGHATSTDLLTWTEHPVAIACDENEDIFSGSIVHDRHNTSGFGTGSTAPLVAIYTSAFKPGSLHEGVQAQSLAYSLDGGYSWTKHGGNPVLSRGSAEFRDPKVMWYDGGADSYWVMVAVEATDFQVVLYKSRDLKSWELLSTFGPANATGGVWECPDLFPLPVDGDPENVKWVLTVNLNPGGPNHGSAGHDFIGDFDGTTFTSASTVTEPAGRLPMAGLGPGLLRRRLLQRRAGEPPPHDRLDEQLGVRQPDPHHALAQPHEPRPGNFTPGPRRRTVPGPAARGRLDCLGRHGVVAPFRNHHRRRRAGSGRRGRYRPAD